MTSTPHRAAAWFVVVATLLAAVLTTLAAPAGASTATTTFGRPIRILLSGDSITQGFNGDYTWRLRLWQEFQRQGVPVDFVGSQTAPHVAPGFHQANYLDPNFDTNHFAFGGMTLAWLADRIQAEVAAQQPDVVVIAAGVNDLRNKHSVQQTLDSLRTFVGNVRAAAPDAGIIVSPVLPATEHHMKWLPGAIRNYDAALPGVVAELSTAGSPVTLANTTAGWSEHADSYLDLHPNPTGETLIAQHIAEALQQAGVLPDTPQVYQQLPWLRNLSANVKVRHGKVRVSWDRESVTGVRVWLRRQGKGARFLPGRRTAGPVSLGHLNRGRYEIRLIAIRHRMSSPLGPVTSFRVR